MTPTTRQIRRMIQNAAGNDDLRCTRNGCAHKLSYHNEKGCHFIGCHCEEFTVE